MFGILKRYLFIFITALVACFSAFLSTGAQARVPLSQPPSLNGRPSVAQKNTGAQKKALKSALKSAKKQHKLRIKARKSLLKKCRKQAKALSKLRKKELKAYRKLKGKLYKRHQQVQEQLLAQQRNEERMRVAEAQRLQDTRDRQLALQRQQQAQLAEARRLQAERDRHQAIQNQKEEQDRLEAGRREAERLEQERRDEIARREVERIEEEHRIEAARREAERLEQERRDESRREAKRLERERLADEARRQREEEERNRIEKERRAPEAEEASENLNSTPDEEGEQVPLMPVPVAPTPPDFNAPAAKRVWADPLASLDSEETLHRSTTPKKSLFTFAELSKEDLHTLSEDESGHASEEQSPRNLAAHLIRQVSNRSISMGGDSDSDSEGDDSDPYFEDIFGPADPINIDLQPEETSLPSRSSSSQGDSSEVMERQQSVIARLKRKAESASGNLTSELRNRSPLRKSPSRPNNSLEKPTTASESSGGFLRALKRVFTRGNLDHPIDYTEDSSLRRKMGSSHTSSDSEREGDEWN